MRWRKSIRILLHRFDVFLEVKVVLEGYNPPWMGFETAGACRVARFVHRTESPKIAAMEVERIKR